MKYESYPQVVKEVERYARFSIFGFVSTQLELSETQKARIRQTYDAVSEYLAASDDKYLQHAYLYPHGSISIGTAIKPISGVENDVDVMCLLRNAPSNISAQELSACVGNRLKASGIYGPPKLERKKRCWRINFKGDFHLDLTPSIRNPRCLNGGELVPDRELATVKETNPQGFAELFQRRAKLSPTMLLTDAAMGARAEIAALPNLNKKKNLLEITVQLFKRHRDKHFEHSSFSEFKPISIIITTLAMRAYESVVAQSSRTPLDDELSILIAVAQKMPGFIRVYPAQNGMRYEIENETTVGENFADRWNTDARWANCFSEWHKKLTDDLARLATVEGQDAISQRFSDTFMVPKAPIDRLISSMFILPISSARNAGLVRSIPTRGLIYSGGSGGIVKSNTFFGACP
jgi:hypothetical protein